MLNGMILYFRFKVFDWFKLLFGHHITFTQITSLFTLKAQAANDSSFNADTH